MRFVSATNIIDGDVFDVKWLTVDPKDRDNSVTTMSGKGFVLAIEEPLQVIRLQFVRKGIPFEVTTNEDGTKQIRKVSYRSDLPPEGSSSSEGKVSEEASQAQP